MRTYSKTAFAAILHTLATGSLYVTRDQHCSIATINALAKRHGDLRKTVTVNPRTGQRTHTVAGVMLNRLGLTAMLDACHTRGVTPPAALLDALAQTSPVPAPRNPAPAPLPAPLPTPRNPRQSITRRADPFALVGAPAGDPIPF